MDGGTVTAPRFGVLQAGRQVGRRESRRRARHRGRARPLRNSRGPRSAAREGGRGRARRAQEESAAAAEEAGVSELSPERQVVGSRPMPYDEPRCADNPARRVFFISGHRREYQHKKNQPRRHKDTKKKSSSCFFSVSLCLRGFLISAAPPRRPPPGFMAGNAPPSWIWFGPGGEKQTALLRRSFELKTPIKSAKLVVSADDQAVVYLDGQEVLTQESWAEPGYKDVTAAMTPGPHVIAVRGRNEKSAAGILLRLTFESAAGSFALLSDGSWLASDKRDPGWQFTDFNDAKWSAATVLAPLGGKPWDKVAESTLVTATKQRDPSTTPPRAHQGRQGLQGRTALLRAEGRRRARGSTCASTRRAGSSSPTSTASSTASRRRRSAARPSDDQGRADRRRDRRGAGPALGVRQPLRRGQHGRQVRERPLPRHATPTATTARQGRAAPASSTAAASTARTPSCSRPDGKSLYVVCGNETKLTELDGVARAAASGARTTCCRGCPTAAAS